MYGWLTLSEISPLLPEMDRRKVSEVARSRRGFFTAYRRAGDRRRLSRDWRETRDNFVSRHLAQVREFEEPLWESDPAGGTRPTRRHLALIAWAYTPTGKARLRAYVRRRARDKRRPNAWTRERGRWRNLTPGQYELVRALKREYPGLVRSEYTVSLPTWVQRDWRDDFVSGTPTRYHLDLAIPAYKIAVEVDGPEHSTKDRLKDRVRNEILTHLGWTIARVSKADARHRSDAVVAELRDLIRKEDARGSRSRGRGRGRGRR